MGFVLSIVYVLRILFDLQCVDHKETACFMCTEFARLIISHHGPVVSVIHII